MHFLCIYDTISNLYFVHEGVKIATFFHFILSLTSHVGFSTTQPPVLGAQPLFPNPSTSDPEVKRVQVVL